MSAEKQSTMHIGELAEKTGMSLRTIRHYDEIGLLTPSGRTEGGFRLYTEDDHQRLLLIRRMKPLGYSLERMGELLAAIDAPEVDLASFIEEAESRRAVMATHLEMADEFLTLLRRHER